MKLNDLANRSWTVVEYCLQRTASGVVVAAAIAFYAAAVCVMIPFLAVLITATSPLWIWDGYCQTPRKGWARKVFGPNDAKELT